MFLLIAATLLTQDTVHATRPTCGTCRVEIREVARIHDDILVGQVDAHGIQRVARGGFLFADAIPEAPLQYLGTNGMLRAVGRGGPGPNEWRDPYLITAWLGDSLLVYDRGHARATILTPSLAPVRSFPMPARVDGIVVTPGGDLILSHLSTDTALVGARFARLSPGARAVSRWGDVVPGSLSRAAITRNSSHLVRVGAAVWTVPQFGTARLEMRRLTDGTIQRVVLREASWYPPYGLDEYRSVSAEAPPSPIALGLAALGDSVIVVAWRVPDPQWRRGLGAPRRGEQGRVVYPNRDNTKLFDTVIEMYDARSGVLLASRQFDTYYAGLQSAGLLLAVQIGDDDMTYVVASAALVQ